MEILKNKNLATRFQILVEVAHSGPNVQQRGIAARVGISPQAVSDYVGQLLNEGLLVSDGRSRYRVTSEGTDWILKVLREIHDYNRFIEEAVVNISVAAAVADADLTKGQAVGLVMRNGMLYAAAKPGKSARGIAFADAKKGEDVGVARIEGVVPLTRGKVTVLSVPTVAKGGSRQVDYDRLKVELKRPGPTGVVGIEAVVALKQLDVKPQYAYGAVAAAIEAARCGLPFLLVVTADAVHSVLARIEAEDLAYGFVDLDKNTG